MEIITTDDPIYKEWIVEHELQISCDHSSLEIIKYDASDLLARVSSSDKKYVMFYEEELQVTEAAYRAASEIEDAVLIYGDSDELCEGKRQNPFFKPDWSPDTFRSFFYLGHTAIYNREKLQQLLQNIDQELSQYELTAYYIEETQAGREEIIHVPEIFYHEYTDERVAQDKYEMPRYGLPNNQQGLLPKASIVIPSKDNPEILKQCVDSIVDLSTYTNYEIIVVDNGSNSENHQWISAYLEEKGARYLYNPMEFNFSKMCNDGVTASTGDVVILLNDDILISQADWLEIMVEQALQEHTGAVGAKLYYPDSKKIQHIGVINLEVGPSHAFSLENDEGDLYFGRNIATYNNLIVTAACLAVTREKYNEVGGLDEDLRIAYNDVDFCLNLYERGYYNVVRNDVQLFHYESISRGTDNASEEKKKRLLMEQERLYSKHPNLRDRDPFYNENLVQDRLDFSIKVDESKICTGKVKWLVNAPGTQQNMPISIDKLAINENVYLKGWLCSGNYNWDEEAPMYVLLPYGQNYLEIPVKKEKRLDVQSIFSTESDNLGFVCVFPREYLMFPDALVGISIHTKDGVFHQWSGLHIEVGEMDYVVPEELNQQEYQVICSQDKTDEYLSAVDRWFVSGNRLFINGWAFKSGDKNNMKYHYNVIVLDESHYYRIPVKRIERYDLCNQFADQNYILYSGFEADCEFPQKLGANSKLYLQIENMETQISSVVRLN